MKAGIAPDDAADAALADAIADVGLRPGTIADSAALNRFYNPFIRESVATFEHKELSLDDRRRWFEARAGDPLRAVVVAEGVAAEGDGEIVGFSAASAFDWREGYRSSVKTSVFVAPAMAGRGLGRRLYTALFQALEGTEAHRAYALVVYPNPASVRLHASFGFEEVGRLSEVGAKGGRLHDVLMLEKRL